MSFSIAWVTPFGKRSDVSAFSRNILIALSDAAAKTGGSITIFANENGANYWSDLPIVTLTGTSQDREMLLSFDYVIFNIGNNSGNHRHINWLAQEIPGIVIVHDMVMQHFLAEEIFERFQRKSFYARLIGEYYGEPGVATIGQSQICNQTIPPIYAPWDSLHVAEMPLLEPFIQGAAAVIVHSNYAQQFVAKNFSGPTLQLALPWDQKPYLTDSELSIWRTKTSNRAKCHIVCFGYIGRAKCLDQVITAFAESSLLRNRAKLTIAGYPGDRDYTDELCALVRAGGLESTVAFEFSISDERLLALKTDADVFVNLRFPNTESASGSIVEQMNAGKPVLVYPSGCYAEIPTDAAIFVQNTAGIINALEEIVGNAEARIRIGNNGRNYVRRIGRAEYVKSLLKFLKKHRKILQERKQYSIGRRAPMLEPNGDHPWLDQIIHLRRLFFDLRRPIHEIPVAPFLSWKDPALLTFINAGIFGQPPGSPFEHECRNLLTRTSRLDLCHIIGHTNIIFLFTKNDQDLIKFLPSLALPSGDAFLLMRALGDEAFVKTLYIGLLARFPTPQEIESCISALVRSPIEKIIRDFLSSEEFQHRGLSHTALLEWCEQDHLSPLLRPHLDLDQPIRFTPSLPECRSYLGTGWHQIEDGHVWSRSAVSTLMFSTAEECASANFYLAIEGRTLGTTRTMRAGCNGDADLAINIANDNWFSFELPLSCLANAGDAFVVLLDAGTTINLTADQDVRPLGFCLRSICLRRKTI